MDRAATEGRIRFEGPSGGCRLGDTVRGRLVLSPELDGVDHVTVGLAFETAGSCDSERAVLHRSQVRRASGDRELTVAFDGPRWPPTYRGRLFTGCWYVEAQAGTEVTRAELAVDTEHGPADVRVVDQRQHHHRPRPTARRVRRLAILGLVEAACIAVMVIGLSRGEGYWAAGLVVGLLLLPAILGTALGLASTRAAGELSVEVRPAETGLAVQARVGDHTRVGSVTATLVVRERTQRLAGLDNREHREQVIHECSVTLAPDASGGFTATVPVPPYPQAPFTMSHSTAQVGWSLHVHAAITGGPDQTRSVALVARPKGASAPQPRWTTG